MVQQVMLGTPRIWNRR
jgi:hypothetical protein